MVEKQGGLMKRGVRALNQEAVRRQFPLVGQVAGWFFRVAEESPGHYHAEGTDLWGRRVSRHGDDPHALLADCYADARSIVARVSKDG